MTSLARFLVRATLAVLLGLASAGVRADDLLYARCLTPDGKTALFTVDLQTGERTFVSDGPIKEIANPAFDEPHHTILYPFAWLTVPNPQYYFLNPFTAEFGGPYLATLSYPGQDPEVDGFEVDVYAPTTQRLYTVTWLFDPTPNATRLCPTMWDQFAGPKLLNWGSYASAELLPPGSDGYPTAATFDPLTGMILVSVGTGLAVLDPVSGYWQQPIAFAEYQDIRAMAAEPTTGDIYYVRTET